MRDFGQEPLDTASFSKTSTTRTSQSTESSDSGASSSSTFTETTSNIGAEFSLAEIVGTILALIALCLRLR